MSSFEPKSRFTPLVAQIVLSHIQHVARHYGALKCPMEKIVELVIFSLGDGAPEAAELARFLRLESTQIALEAEWETGLWPSTDRNKTWRLVCLALPDSIEKATAKLKARPPHGDACCWCWISEPGRPGEPGPRGDQDGLAPYVRLDGRAVGGIQLHRACKSAWTRLENLVMRSAGK